MPYTKNGDKGKTSLFGRKQKISKSSLVIEALGEIDELNSLIGICKNEIGGYNSLREELEKTQNDLFAIQAEIAGADKRLKKNSIVRIEEIIRQEEKKLELKHFVLPGANKNSALLDYLRAVARRVERRIVALSEKKNVSPEILAYLNRLSSLFYTLARREARKNRKREKTPDY